MHKATIEIVATPERVFAYLTDPKHLGSWQRDVVETRPIPPGGLRVGTRVGATVKEYGRIFDVDLMVAALTPNQHIAYDVNAPAAYAHIDYRLVRWGDYTRVVSMTAVRPKGFLRLLSFLVKRILQRKMESRLRLLREAVEGAAGTTASSPADRASASQAVLA